MTLASVRDGALLLLLGILIAKLLQRLVPFFTSPLNRLRGPPSASFVYGNVLQLAPDNIHLAHRWLGEYGPTLRLNGLFGAPRLYTTDHRAINHILTHSMDYFKPDDTRRSLARIVGQGVLVTEGERHRQQRRVMNPGFGPAQIRELTEIFLEKAGGLCEYWRRQMAENGSNDLRTNVIEGLSKMTLDVIGLAGFNYPFEALNPDLPPNELNKAFHEIFKTPLKLSVANVIRNLLPKVKLLQDDRARKVDAAQKAMQRIGRQIMQERKAEIMREFSGHVEKNDVQGRDLLTLLIKANMATDIPDNQRMTDEEVLAQVPTFLVAGHETTSTATTWALYALSLNLPIQQKLREELFTISTDTPTMEDLMALPYLDQVVRETLRLHAPVTATVRDAIKDDVIPLSEPITDKQGNVLHEVRIAKGNTIIIPILALQTSKAIWGADAFEFRPERWDNPPEAISSIPGVWGHLLTFLGGPHACIGYRFSLVEMKALLFTLIRSFEFELACSKEDIAVMGPFIQRPYLQSEKPKGAQLPLIIRPYKKV